MAACFPCSRKSSQFLLRLLPAAVVDPRWRLAGQLLTTAAVPPQPPPSVPLPDTTLTPGLTCTRKCMRRSPAAVSSAFVLSPRPEMMKIMMIAGSLMLYSARMYPPVAPSLGTAAAKPMATPRPMINLYGVLAVGKGREGEGNHRMMQELWVARGDSCGCEATALQVSPS